MHHLPAGAAAALAAVGGYAALYRLGQTWGATEQERAFLSTIIPADFVMARSHLRGLQQRAESGCRPGRGGTGGSQR